jgi:RIO kinase 1
MFNEDDESNQTGRRDKARTDRKPKKWQAPVAPLSPEAQAAEAAFALSVQVTNTERAWIKQHLTPFLHAKLISDVVRRVRAGKEATVYTCAGHPSTGHQLIAAKLYRARSLRSMKNTSQYQEGRTVLNADGAAIAPHKWRLQKAIAKKSKKGLSATQTSWLMHEFVVMRELHQAGADVPEPIEHNEHALLMEFIGEGEDPAPTLNEVTLEHAEASQLFARVTHNLELLLGLGWVHGDLSAYNILYHRGKITFIDFPQVVHALNNPQARSLFERDVERVAQYFAHAGVQCDHRRLADELWAKHVEPGAAGGAEGRAEEEDERDGDTDRDV